MVEGVMGNINSVLVCQIGTDEEVKQDVECGEMRKMCTYLVVQMLVSDAWHGSMKLNQMIWEVFAANGNATHLGNSANNLAELGYNSN